jgi:hypothetical protein
MLVIRRYLNDWEVKMSKGKINLESVRRNLYVPLEKADIWSQAMKLAKELDVSISELTTIALTELLKARGYAIEVIEKGEN